MVYSTSFTLPAPLATGDKLPVEEILHNLRQLSQSPPAMAGQRDHRNHQPIWLELTWYTCTEAANCHPWCSPTKAPTECSRGTLSSSASTSAEDRQPCQWTVSSPTPAPRTPHRQHHLGGGGHPGLRQHYHRHQPRSSARRQPDLPLQAYPLPQAPDWPGPAGHQLD